MAYVPYPAPPVERPWILRLSLAALLFVAVAAARPERAGGRTPTGPPQTMASQELVINEVDYDQPSEDTAEFVEIKNVGGQAIELGDYDLVGLSGHANPASEYGRWHLDPTTLLPGAYYVLGAATVPRVDQVVGTSSIWQNGAPDALAIVVNQTGDPADDILVDSVSYEGDTQGGPPSGGSWTETIGETPGDSATVSYVGISRWPDGTDTDHNDNDFSVRCITPGEANTEASDNCPPPGDPTPSIDPTGTATAATGATATSELPTTPTDSPSLTPTHAPTATATETVTATATGIAPATPTATSAATPTDDVAGTATAAAAATATAGSEPPDATATAPGNTLTETPDPPRAAELVSMRAYRLHDRVVLVWETATEVHHAGFRVLRSQGAGAPAPITQGLIPPQHAGGEIAGARYIFVDTQPPAGGASYWLVDVDTHGRSTRHGPVDVGARQPPRYPDESRRRAPAPPDARDRPECL